MLLLPIIVVITIIIIIDSQDESHGPHPVPHLSPQPPLQPEAGRVIQVVAACPVSQPWALAMRGPLAQAALAKGPWRESSGPQLQLGDTLAVEFGG